MNDEVQAAIEAIREAMRVEAAATARLTAATSEAHAAETALSLAQRETRSRWKLLETILGR